MKKSVSLILTMLMIIDISCLFVFATYDTQDLIINDINNGVGTYLGYIANDGLNIIAAYDESNRLLNMEINNQTKGEFERNINLNNVNCDTYKFIGIDNFQSLKPIYNEKTLNKLNRYFTDNFNNVSLTTNEYTPVNNFNSNETKFYLETTSSDIVLQHWVNNDLPLYHTVNNNKYYNSITTLSENESNTLSFEYLGNFTNNTVELIITREGYGNNNINQLLNIMGLYLSYLNENSEYEIINPSELVQIDTLKYRGWDSCSPDPVVKLTYTLPPDFAHNIKINFSSHWKNKILHVCTY